MTTKSGNIPRLLSGRVKQTLPDGNIQFVSLATTEQYLGVPAANGYMLISTTDGNRSWADPTAHPAGNNTQIQYNNNGNFAGSNSFTFDSANTLVTISGDLVANSITIGAGAYEFSRSNVFFSTTNSLTPVTMLSINANGISAVDYTIISTDASANIREFSKVSTAVIGTSLEYVEYDSLQVNGFVGEFSVAYGSGPPGTINLNFTPSTANLLSHKINVTVYYD